MIGSDTLVYRMLFNLTENAIRYNRPDGAVTISICKDEKVHSKFAWQIRASEFRSSTGKASFSHSSAWTSPGAGNTAVSDWDFLWSGKSRHFTAAR